MRLREREAVQLKNAADAFQLAAGRLFECIDGDGKRKRRPTAAELQAAIDFAFSAGGAGIGYLQSLIGYLGNRKEQEPRHAD